MRYAWPVFVLLTAVAVAVAVFAILNLQAPERSVEGLSLTDPRGEPFLLDQLKGRVWVVGFLGSGCESSCPNRERMDQLRRELPEQVQLLGVLFDPADSLAAADWTVAHGSKLRVRELAVAHWGHPARRLDELLGGASVLPLCSLTPSGGIRGHYTISAGNEDAVQRTLLDDVDFLLALGGRPRLHATLNATTALMLILGFIAIRRKRIALHLACMVGAALVTLVFLASYLYYHAHAGSMPFSGEGWVRPLYFGILLSHTVLAALVAPLALSLFYLAARRRFSSHRRIARWTLPLWLYVSVTGVAIYCMLYIWFAPS